jgi:hypothetical protein
MSGEPEDIAAEADAHAVALASAIVLSMLDEPDIRNPGPESAALLKSINMDILDAIAEHHFPYEQMRRILVTTTQAATVATYLAQVLVTIVRSLEAEGVVIDPPLRDQLSFGSSGESRQG